MILAGRAAADLSADHFGMLKFAVKITNYYSSLNIQPNTFGVVLNWREYQKLSININEICSM